MIEKPTDEATAVAQARQWVALAADLRRDGFEADAHNAEVAAMVMISRRACYWGIGASPIAAAEMNAMRETLPAKAVLDAENVIAAEGMALAVASRRQSAEADAILETMSRASGGDAEAEQRLMEMFGCASEGALAEVAGRSRPKVEGFGAGPFGSGLFPGDQPLTATIIEGER